MGSILGADMNIFCSGIGGIGLSAYASHMNSAGHRVWGSDAVDSPLLDDVRSQGISVSLTQDGSALPQQLDVLVYSEAISESSPERMLAKERGVRQLSYFHALGEMTSGSTVIAICGTHGKSSTTAMCARMMIECGKDPNIVVGTKLRELDGRNWRKGSQNLWIVEACEYRRSFLFLSPSIILLTNADGDHFDSFRGIEDYHQAFVDFISLLPTDGTVIAHGSDTQAREIILKSGWSFTDADSEPLITLATPGLHMRKNAQLALSLGKLMDIPDRAAQAAVSSYSGSWRRMELRGTTAQGIPVIDDYAHHPVEIRATLSAMREAFPGKRLVVIFQPHTHHRTLALWNEFSASFGDASIVIVTDIYDARPENSAQKASLEHLVADIQSHTKNGTVYAGGSLQNTEVLLRSGLLTTNDVLVFLGAGSITTLAGVVASHSA